MQKATSFTPMTWQQPPRKRTAAQRKAMLAKRDAWLQEIDPASLFHRLFDLIPGVYFFAKSRKDGLMFFSQNLRETHHLADEADVIGLSVFDTDPPDMAEAYEQDDAQIYATGLPSLNQVKLGFDEQGVPDWFVVNKMPIRSRTGEIIGVMGFRQSYEGRVRLLQPFQRIAKAVNHIRQNYAQNITVTELARLSGLSKRQLERKFKATFGVGPQRFLIKTRLLAACRALRESDQNLAEIAASCGFNDQSAFSRHFHRLLGATPSEFRQQAKLG